MKIKNTALLVGVLALSFGLASCNNEEPTTDKEDTTIESDLKEVYNKLKETGKITVSYEEWVKTIKGDDGSKGDKGDKGETGPIGETGKDGKEITKVEFKEKTATDDIYLITFNDNSTIEVKVPLHADSVDYYGKWTEAPSNRGPASVATDIIINKDNALEFYYAGNYTKSDYTVEKDGSIKAKISYDFIKRLTSNGLDNVNDPIQSDADLTLIPLKTSDGITRGMSFILESNDATGYFPLLRPSDLNKSLSSNYDGVRGREYTSFYYFPEVNESLVFHITVDSINAGILKNADGTEIANRIQANSYYSFKGNAKDEYFRIHEDPRVVIVYRNDTVGTYKLENGSESDLKLILDGYNSCFYDKVVTDNYTYKKHSNIVEVESLSGKISKFFIDIENKTYKPFTNYTEGDSEGLKFTLTAPDNPLANYTYFFNTGSENTLSGNYYDADKTLAGSCSLVLDQNNATLTIKDKNAGSENEAVIINLTSTDIYDVFTDFGSYTYVSDTGTGTIQSNLTKDAKLNFKGYFANYDISQDSNYNGCYYDDVALRGTTVYLDSTPQNNVNYILSGTILEIKAGLGHSFKFDIATKDFDNEFNILNPNDSHQISKKMFYEYQPLTIDDIKGKTFTQTIKVSADEHIILTFEFNEDGSKCKETQVAIIASLGIELNKQEVIKDCQTTHNNDYDIDMVDCANSEPHSEVTFSKVKGHVVLQEIGNLTIGNIVFMNQCICLNEVIKNK